MARKTGSEIAVGITVLVVLGLTIYVVVTLADWSSLTTPQQEITVRLPYKVGLKGLGEGSPVHLGGVKIGQITRVHISKLDPNNPGTDDIYVFFTMRIPQQYQLRSDCVLLPQSNVLGGQVLLSIDDLGREGEIIGNGRTADLTLGDTMMDTIKREFDLDAPDSILALMKYEIDRGNKDSVVSSLKSVAAELEKGIPAVTDQIEQTFAKVDVALETAQSVLTDLKELTGDERLGRIVGNMAEVSVNLKLTSREVRRAPWKLLYKPNQKEFKIQALVDSAGAFAAGAERLDSAALSLRRVMTEAGDKLSTDNERIKAMVAELEGSFEQFQKAERKFWEELD